MVRALLDGTKTQTRRVCKLPPAPANLGQWEPFIFGGEGCRDSHGRPVSGQMTIAHSRTGAVVGCPYGIPGDRLWVREAIRLVPDQEPDDGTGRVLSTYGADGSLTVADAWPWKRSYLPPMHCPRGLSRIDLEVTGVRVERLQDISEADAQAEGCALECMTPTGDDSGSAIYGPGGYRALWESINGLSSWDANPWVWVVEFRRIRP
jgi:hypothetical protein